MNMGYVFHTAETLHGLKGQRLSNGLKRIKSLLDRYAMPAMPGIPLGVHMPDRVWRRHAALLMCLQDRWHDHRS